MSLSENIVEYAHVSVVIPCYRCDLTIERAVDSVVKQELLPKELILVDDGSNDSGKTLETLHLIRDKYSDYLDVKVIGLDVNSGAAVARNTGWRLATQDYIAFLDADDIWYPEKIRIQYSWMIAHQKVTLSGHLSEVRGEGETHLDSKPYSMLKNRQVTPLALLFSNCFSTRTVMLKRSVPFKFDPTMRRSEDYLLWLNLILDGHDGWQLEVPLAASFKRDYGEGGLSKDLWRMEKAEIAAYLKLFKGKLISLPCLVVVVAWSFVRYVRRFFLSSY